MMTTKHGEDHLFDRLARLPTAASRIKFATRRRLLSPLTVKRLSETVSSLVRVDVNKARRLASATVTLANKLGDAESRAFALRAKANSLWFMGRNRAATHLHEQATRLFGEAGQTIEVGRTLSSSIQPLILLGEYNCALEAADRARQIFAAAGEKVRLARLEINIGNLFHRQDRFREALACYQRAYSELTSANDIEGIVAALHNVAMCLTMLDEFEKAVFTYGQARTVAKKARMPLAVAQAEYNIAYLHYLRGHYAQAIAMLRRAHKLSEKAGNKYRAALCKLDLSEIYLELNLTQEAAELAGEAFSSFLHLRMRYEAAKALCASAVALSQEGHGLRAIALFRRARALFVKEKNQVWPSLVDLYQAWAYFKEGRLHQARRHCVSALTFFRASPLCNRAILCRLLLARLSLRTGNIESARRECSIALRDLSGKEMPILTYQGHLTMGQIEQATHNLQEAKRHYRLAKDVLDTLRSGIWGQELRICFMSSRLEVFENLVEICLLPTSTPETLEEAWTYMEEGKSRNLFELIARQFDPVAENRGSKGLARQIVDFRERLNWYYHRIEVEQLGQTPPSDERLLALQKLAEEHEQKLVEALREVDTSAAEVSGVQLPVPVPLDVLRATLGAEVTLIEYFRIRDRFLACVVTENGLEITPITNTARIAQALRMFQFQLSKFRLDRGYVLKFGPSLLEATQAHLYELYQELLAPLRQQLKGRRLLVVPHEALHHVPFHALFDGMQYLIDSFAVSYAPSASIYVQCCKKRLNQAGGSLVLGVADSRAPSVYEEVQSVASTLPDAAVYLGAKATARILRERGPHSRLIHIAAHGFFRHDKPVFSGLRLGDTFLTLYDLYHLRLPAEQITLSGCSTGVNVVAAGDELIGLMRGLLSAGARSLLVSLWDVHDSSTAMFMRCFYGNFFTGLDRASALRRAMLDVKERLPHPYYWAPFVLVGNVLP